MKKAAVVVATCAALYAAYQGYSEYRTARFVAAKKQEFAGYRLEYFADQKLLFLHAPDGSREGIKFERNNIRRVFLHKFPARDNTFNKDLYRWAVRYTAVVDGNGATIQSHFNVPYFSIEPAEFLTLLRAELPEIDTYHALRHAKEFEHDAFHFCTVWMPEGEREIAMDKGYKSCAHER